METNNNYINSEIKSLCDKLVSEFDLISKDRRDKLDKITDYLSDKFRTKETPKLIVICTHNSRRSHMGQIWLAVGAEYYNLPRIESFSGGTEATAFNVRAVNAFRNIGFDITSLDDDVHNPLYKVSWNNEMQPSEAFSKKYDAAPNPKEKFGAIMVCTEADKGCPIVSGCDFRLSLPYEDPKAYDDTELESIKYTERVTQIAREILYALSQVKK